MKTCYLNTISFLLEKAFLEKWKKANHWKKGTLNTYLVVNRATFMKCVKSFVR